MAFAPPIGQCLPGAAVRRSGVPGCPDWWPERLPERHPTSTSRHPAPHGSNQSRAGAPGSCNKFETPLALTPELLYAKNVSAGSVLSAQEPPVRVAPAL